MMKEIGFIYFAANPSMPGIFKIGKTTKHPRIRLKQLSSSTSCADAFSLVACFGSSDIAFVESCIHEELQDFRVNANREFFKCEPEEIQKAFRRWASPGEDICDSYVLDKMVESSIVSKFGY